MKFLNKYLFFSLIFLGIYRKFLPINLNDSLQKKVKNKGDKWIVKDINSEFDEIFFTILKSDPNIEYVKYQNKKLIKSNNIEQKSTNS